MKTEQIAVLVDAIRKGPLDDQGQAIAKTQYLNEYTEDDIERLSEDAESQSQIGTRDALKTSQTDNDGADSLYAASVDFVRLHQSITVSMLQRRFRIGYNQAYRIIEALEDNGIIGPAGHHGSRAVVTTV